MILVSYVQCRSKMEESQSDIEKGDLDADNNWNRSYKDYEEIYKQRERDEASGAWKK